MPDREREPAPGWAEGGDQGAPPSGKTSVRQSVRATLLAQPPEPARPSPSLLLSFSRFLTVRRSRSGAGQFIAWYRATSCARHTSG